MRWLADVVVWATSLAQIGAAQRQPDEQQEQHAERQRDLVPSQSTSGQPPGTNADGVLALRDRLEPGPPSTDESSEAGSMAIAGDYMVD